MRRGILFIFTLPLFLVGFVIAAPAALAQNAHFVSAKATVSGANLIVSWKEAGLGDNTLIDYTASADGTATYVCVNKGGGNPSATNKTTVNGPVSATGAFSSDKNGNINASLTFGPPGPPDPKVFSCPTGQKLQLASASYTNVKIVDNTNDVAKPIPGTFSTGCLLPNVRGACD
jgi:hypothetical protein